MTEHESRWAPLRAAAAVVSSVGILEVLALAPRDQWLWPRVWLTQAVGVALVVAVVGAVAMAARALVARLGWRWSAGSVVAVLALLLIALAHLRPALESGIGAGGPLALLALGLVVAIAFAGLRLLSVRRGLSSREARLVLIALLALPIGLTAARWAAILGPAVRSRPAAALAASGLYLLAVAAAGGWGGRRRSSLLVATMVLAIAALRFAVPNPHQLYLAAPGADGADDRAAAGGGPPVLLIVLDTLRADALELAEPATSSTPHLARFAREADVYGNAISNASWSLPGHASLFTGLNVSEHRTDHTREPGFTNSLPAILPTAQELFAAHGYRTSCVAANPLVSIQTGLARGFQRYLSASADWIHATVPLRLVDLAVPARRGRPGQTLNQIVVDLEGLNHVVAAGEIVDAGLAEIEGEPHALYLFLNFMDAHHPYPPAPGEPIAKRLALLRDWLMNLAGRRSLREVANRHAETLRARYQARARHLDAELGRLFDELRRRGWYEEMLIVVTADHGQALGENPSLGYWGHHSAYEPAVRIPLLIKRPGQRQGEVKRQVVQQADVLPALLAMAGLPARAGLRSRVLDPDLELPVLTEWYPTRGGAGVPYPRLALYRDRYKFVLEGHGEREFLYDLEQSPYEEVDVRPLHGALAARMRVDLDDVVQRSRAAMPDPPATLDPAVEEQLRALGYVN